MTSQLALEEMIDVLKAVAEPSRLRILLLLEQSDLTVSELTQILGQSQPRVSRHLRLLHEAHLIERYQEGAWAYFALAQSPIYREIILSIHHRLHKNDLAIRHDLERLVHVKAQRAKAATSFFSQNAEQWDKLRFLHVSDTTVEKTMLDLVGNTSLQAMLDIGTGTGTLLELFAPLYKRAIGVDINRDMLAVARVKLDEAGINNAAVRLGDAAAITLEKDSFDLVTIYQVLHFLDDPQAALREAARVMRPNARLIIVDFASHDLNFLREQYAHLRLGFSDSQMQSWLANSGLELEKTINFAPSTDNNAKGLTVKLWLARDKRLLMAEQSTTIREIA